MHPLRALATRPLGPAGLLAADGLVALVGALALLGPLLGPGAGAAPAWARALTAASVTVPVAARRRWPRAALAVVVPGAAAAAGLGLGAAAALPVAAVLYTVAVTSERVRLPTGAVAVTAAAAATALVVAGTPMPWVGDLGAAVVSVAVVAGAWSLGRAVRERRAHGVALERERLAAAAQEERLRIARELHDVVGHSVGLIAVKAAVANHLGRGRDGEAAEALAVIERQSRAALAELRSLLGVLRDPGATAGLSPAPRLSALPELAAAAEAAGVEVALELRDATELPEGLEVSAYRIVQEALTNAARHAAPTRCHVLVEARPTDVVVEVTDIGRNGTAPSGTGAGPGPGGGHGLIGMRERVALYGGEFSAGPRAGGGYVVRAVLPCAADGRAAG